MKRIILAIALIAVCGLGLTSCGKQTKHCWEVTVSIEKASKTFYLWGTRDEVDAYVKGQKTKIANASRKRTNKAEKECTGPVRQ